ncbi:ARM repeat-containing protein [Morchella conica CCBAS932]|uniref:ARM repeat-containing protein n=1 Tax=Morchella conica CCBAS932 TaxID=1392247 RepID=A0A3N4LGM1_9PEZI|nr:ARM repeat-containing protein [Morchella conica CCBAS932]
MAEEEPDYSSIPLPDRAVHKIWKVRKGAYEEAAADFARSPDESDPCFQPWLHDSGLWTKVVLDSNVAAQQEGIAALCAFLQYGGINACLRTRSHIIGPLVEKGLSSTRAATKEKSLEALLLYIELDTPVPVMESLVPFLSHKMPKIIAATLSAITGIFAAYGARTVDPKPVLKVLPGAFAHADKNVRAEATKLAIELYKWLKDAIKPMFFNDLKPAQQKDLDEAFEKVKEETPKQERLLRSQQAAGVQEEAVEDEVEVDAFDLAEPVDVLSKMPPEFDEQVSSSKWKERKDALEALQVLINVPRIKDGDFNEIIRALAKCMKDANVAVVTVAANCIELLANGLRKGFAKHKQTVLSPILERLKEKKQSVIDALAKALDAVFGATSLTDILEDILEYLKHKNPNVKLETLRFLIRCLRVTREFPSKPECKNIAEGSAKMLSDTSGPVRDGAAEAMGTLMKIIGERAMNPFLDGLDDIRKAKIKEFFETAEVKAKEKPKPVAPPPPPPVATKAPAKKVLKSGSKTVKKIAPPSQYAQEPAKPSEAPRAIPGSKMAPKSGLKLQKKTVAPGAGSSLASPRRTAPPPRELTPDEEPAPPPPKTALRGLASRQLSREQPVAPGLGAAEKAELEELRADKERWARQLQEDKSEKARLLQEINDLQLQNAQLIEEHTRDNLSIRAKEAQLVRSRADAESAEAQVQKQQREIERLKRELARAVRPTSPAPTDISEHLYGRESSLGGSYGGHMGRGGMDTNRNSFQSTFSTEDSYNGGGSIGTTRDRMSPNHQQESGRTSAAGSSTDNIESWKRAAEVTSQLKLRIEQMKAKQGLASRGQR